MMQREYIGFESIQTLKEMLHKNHVKNIFLVTGKNSYSSCGAEAVLKQLLLPYSVTRFYDFEENPKIEDVEKGMKLFKEKDYDIVIAVGGGSVIDTAKLINIFSAQAGKALGYIKKGKNIEKKGKSLVAVPTTAGSGSEATHFAVVYVDKTKYSVAHEYILPDYSIIDPQFTMSLPKHITASTGIDALSQAIESYWCVNSTEESKEYSKEAVKLIMENIVEAVNKPSEKSRDAMAKAAHLAGKAINITKTTAPHAISYTLTSYFGIPHGYAVGLTLGNVLVYNSKVSEKDVLDKRGAIYVKKAISEICNILEVEDPSAAKNKINTLMHETGLKTELSDLGIKTEKDMQLILDNVNVERLANNPRIITKQTLRKLLTN